MNMKKTLVLTIALAMLTSCGRVESVSDDAKTSGSSTETTTEVTTSDEPTTSAETATETAETSASSTSQNDAQDENSDAVTWLGRGVYIAVKNGVPDRSWYVFYDTGSGKTANSDTGMGIGFTCEQTKDSITFHFGSIEDNSVMTMSKDEEGNITGTMNGDSYVFYYQSDMDPDTFNAAEVDGRGDIITDDGSASDGAILNYIGEYSNGRAIMNVLPGPKGASVTVKWAGSALVSSTWTMDGTYTLSGDDLIITYSDCVKTTTSYNSDGTLESEETEYTDGTGTITVHYNGTAEWADNVENAAEGDEFTLLR